MDFFSKIGNKVSSVASNATSKVRDFADTTTLNRQISNNQGRIKELYSEIGAIYYKKNKEAPSEEFAAAFAEIASLMEKNEELKTQVQIAKKTKICPNCHEELPLGTAFCPKCGTKAPEDPVAPAAPEKPETITCPGCGKVCGGSESFCPECGCKLS